MDSLSSGVADVFRTVVTGNVEQIQTAIRHKKSDLFREKDAYGHNILHYACMYNRDDVATWMLSLNIKELYTNHIVPKDTDTFGVTAVMYAARAGMVTFVTEWIKQKSEIHTVDKNGWNILRYCFGEGEVIPDLPGARGKQKSVDEQLMKQMVQLLLQNGVNCSVVDKTGKTAIQYMIDHNLDQYLSLIANHSCGAMNIWRNESLETIQVLLSKKIQPSVKINTRTVEVFGGFMHLCVMDCFTIETKLNDKIEKFENTITGAKLDVNEVDDNGMTGLHYLCYVGFSCEPYGLREILIGKLLKLGADPNIKDIRGYTPLMCALEKKYVKNLDPTDPRNGNEQRIAKLLNANVENTSKVDLLQAPAQANLIVQIEDMMQKQKAQEELNQNFNKEINELKASKEVLSNILADKCKEIKDLKLLVTELEKRVESQDGNVPTSSLLLGNLTLPDVCRHLETHIEVACSSDVTFEELQVIITNEDKQYKNVYLVTGHNSTKKDVQSLISEYKKFIVTAKDRAAKIIVSSLLPTLESEKANTSIDHFNKALEVLCEETGCHFVRNDSTFKYMNGSVIEACFEEDGKTLTEFGVWSLLRNLGLLTSKKKSQATSI